MTLLFDTFQMLFCSLLFFILVSKREAVRELHALSTLQGGPIEVVLLDFMNPQEGEGEEQDVIQAGTADDPGYEKFEVHSDGHIVYQAVVPSPEVLAGAENSEGKPQFVDFTLKGDEAVAVFSKNSSHFLNVEVFYYKELRTLFLQLHKQCQTQPFFTLTLECVQEHARISTSQVLIPDTLAEHFYHKFHPFADQIPIVKKFQQDDHFIFANNLAFEVTIRLAHFADESEAGKLIDFSESTVVATLAGNSNIVLKPKRGQVFFISPSSADAQVSKSTAFVYPGELSFVSISASSNSEQPLALETEVLDEDRIRIFLSTVASSCADSVQDDEQIKECLGSKAAAPDGGVIVPSAIAVELFELLYGGLQYWRLCHHDSDTEPLGYVNFELGGGTPLNRTVLASVLHLDPLMMVVHELFSAEECRDFAAAKETSDIENLEMAVEFGGGVAGAVTKNRRTLTTHFHPNLEDSKHPATRLTKLAFELAVKASGFNVQPKGQEPFVWLHYLPGYYYKGHTDGASGDPHVREGDRVATSLTYCRVADEGGGTVFPNVKVKVTPKAGTMLFFTYNPDPKTLTEHAACPVLKGVKTTATQWYRENLNSNLTWQHVDGGMGKNKPGPGHKKKPPFVLKSRSEL
eukprot:TRINITY_DN24227_c0_g1_i1.p1 TRINITY_DN24227_c0_g1~~TRINITY_DN24227_c0_g1_i1.p1  ORF type:complete len:633 (+),score=97.92 TRINITY_DN24227_c0_g1_i1:86-1984(+)